MRKIVMAVMALVALVAFGTSAQAQEKSLLPGGVINSCVAVAEYSDGWVKYTDRQIDSSPILGMTEFDRLHMKFSGLKLDYSRTSKSQKKGELDYDIYAGHLSDGRLVQVTISPDKPQTLFLKVGDVHLKLLQCVHK